MAHGNRVALITGANKGIGLETARQLGAKGVTVIVGARDSAKAEHAAAAVLALVALAHSGCYESSGPRCGSEVS